MIGRVQVPGLCVCGTGVSGYTVEDRVGYKKNYVQTCVTCNM